MHMWILRSYSNQIYSFTEVFEILYKFVSAGKLADTGNTWVVPPTASRLTPRNAGLLDGVKIGPPTRTRVTLGNTVSVGNTIVG